MRHVLIAFLALFVAALFAGCGDEAAHDDHEDKTSREDDDGHDDDDHDSHADDEKHHLGNLGIGDAVVSVILIGELEAGGEIALDVEIDDPHERTAKGVRAWVGVESGKGSMRAKLDGARNDHHGHLEVPAKLPPGSAVWVEVEFASGPHPKAHGSFALPGSEGEGQ